MRLASSWVVGLTLGLTAPALGQAMKPADLVGTWRGPVEYPQTFGNGIGWLTLWPDSTWWFWDSQDGNESGWGNHGGGRWRLAGDTLWVADDTRYWPALQAKIVIGLGLKLVWG
jgi:hypothetical protein